MSDNSTQPNGELAGWKQIAAYLRVSIRTAQSLEKEHGLPVRRGAGLKGPVFALPFELDRWKERSRSETTNTEALIIAPVPSVPRRQFLRYAVGGSAVAAAGAVLGYGVPRLRVGQRNPPTTYRVEGAMLCVFGADGSELWQYAFLEELDEFTYRMERTPYGVKQCIFADVDGDGCIETVFRVVPKANEGECSIVCFDQTGSVRWKFVPNESVSDNLGRTFAPPYWPVTFHLFRAEGPDRTEIVVSSVHNWSFATYVSRLDARTGKLLSRYWHRGHLLYMISADLFGSRKPSVVLGGVNDAPEHNCASLVIFDPENISGASRSPKGKPYFVGTTPGTEKRIIFFPRTGTNKDKEFNIVSTLRVASGRVTVTVVESTNVADPADYVVYEFDGDLRPITVALSNPLMEHYSQLWKDRILPRETFEAVTERLKSEIVIV